MKIISLTPDEIAMGVQLGKERAARGELMPHAMLRLPNGTLMLIRIENMHWPNRRARREAIATARIPRPDESCSRCGVPLSGGTPALLVFRPGGAGSAGFVDHMECSALCHRCAALPDEELLAAHIRRGQKIVPSSQGRGGIGSVSSPGAIAEANQMTETQQIRDFVTEQFANASNYALGLLKTKGKLPPLYFIWLRDGSEMLMCSNSTLAPLYWVAGDTRMVAHFAGAWSVPKDAPDESDQRREVVVGEIIVRADDGVQFVYGWTREIQRGADGTITGFGELTNEGQLQSEVLDAFPRHPPSPAACAAARRQLNHQLRKLGSPTIVHAAAPDIVH